jgi:hypothetical protein
LGWGAHAKLKQEPCMIEIFQEWYDNRHEYARNWKEKAGGMVMGS